MRMILRYVLAGVATGLLIAGTFSPLPAQSGAPFDETPRALERIGREANPPETPAPKSAQALWDAYLDFGTGFDSAIADLYADSAIIRNTRRYPDGRTQVLRMSGEEYKALIRRAMPIARARGDMDVYSNVQLQEVGDRVRITATRYSTLKKYRAPHQLIVGNTGDGGWKILEETGESRP
jgi:hypothetical protein